MRERLLLAASFLYLACMCVIWIYLDKRPPFWDMAYHQSGALRILEAFREEGILAVFSVPGLTGYYPSFYHSVVALFYGVFGVSPDVARLAICRRWRFYSFPFCHKALCSPAAAGGDCGHSGEFFPAGDLDFA